MLLPSNRKRGRSIDQWRILRVPLTSCVLAALLCAAATAQILHLWQHYAQQRIQMDRLETSVNSTRSRRDAQQALLEKNFDPQQIQPLLREKYGLIGPQDRLIQFATMVQR